jgi:hypothetical protein
MKTKPAVRCHHIPTSGVQCASPAVGTTRYCYYHMQGRSTAIKYYSEAPYTAIEEDLPLFEDAHSIQIAIRQIASLLMQQKIDHKAAGLLLYSIQLALLNLKQLKAEKPLPAQVIVDLEEIEQTLPESAFTELAPSETPSETPSESPRQQPQSEKSRKKANEPTPEEVQEQMDYLIFLGKHLDEPAHEFPTHDEFIRMDRALREGALGDIGEVMRTIPKEKIEETLRGKPKQKSDSDLPPGTIQACMAVKLKPARRNVG